MTIIVIILSIALLILLMAYAGATLDRTKWKNLATEQKTFIETDLKKMQDALDAYVPQTPEEMGKSFAKKILYGMKAIEIANKIIEDSGKTKLDPNVWKGILGGNENE